MISRLIPRSCAQRIAAGGGGGGVILHGWRQEQQSLLKRNSPRFCFRGSTSLSPFPSLLNWGEDQHYTPNTRYLTTTRTRLRTTQRNRRQRAAAGGRGNRRKKGEKGGGGASSIDLDFYNNKVGKQEHHHHQGHTSRPSSRDIKIQQQQSSSANRRGTNIRTNTNDNSGEKLMRYNRSKRGVRRERKALVNILYGDDYEEEEEDDDDDDEEEEEVGTSPHQQPHQRMFREDWIEKKKKNNNNSNKYAITNQKNKNKQRRDLPTEQNEERPKQQQKQKLEEDYIKHFPPFRCNVFISCLPGLEPILHQEMMELLKDDTSLLRIQPGGIEITKSLSMERFFDCHLHLGTASHILLRCGKPFVARGFPELTRKVSKQPWNQFLLKNNRPLPIKMKITTKKSRLNHKTPIRDALLAGMNESLLKMNNNSKRTVVYHAKDEDDEDGDDRKEDKEKDERPFLRLVVRIDHDVCQISIDTWHTPMHKRGYRLATAKAPLREDLAFAMVYGAGWRRERFNDLMDRNDDDNPLQHEESQPAIQGLLDPFCGSGTIAIEAASIAAGLPPGRLKGPPLYGTIWYRPKQWKQKLDKILRRRPPPRSRRSSAKLRDDKTTVQQQQQRIISASDRDQGAIDAAKANAERAGVQDWIDFRAVSISSQPWLELPNNKKRNPPDDDDVDTITTDTQQLKDSDENSTTGCYPCLIVTNPPWGMRVATGNSNNNNRNSKKKKNRVHPLLPLYQTLLHKQNRLNQNGHHVTAVTLLQDLNLFRKTGEADSMNVMWSSQHGGVPVAAVSTGPSIIDNTSSTAPITMQKNDGTSERTI